MLSGISDSHMLFFHTNFRIHKFQAFTCFQAACYCKIQLRCISDSQMLILYTTFRIHSFFNCLFSRRSVFQYFYCFEMEGLTLFAAILLVVVLIILLIWIYHTDEETTSFVRKSYAKMTPWRR